MSVGLTCPSLGANPPSVFDREAQPTADDLLPQIAGVLTPRGPVWGTDEVGDGSGTSPIQRRFWRALAAWTADHLGRDWTAATQALPSAITYTLPDWEVELGLPDPCRTAASVDQRAAAVRARFGSLGPVSPTDYRCVALGMGYAVTVGEPRQFRCGDSDSVCGDTTPDLGGEVAGDAIPETAFRCGDTDSQCGATPITGFGEREATGTVSKFMIIRLASGGDTVFRCGDPASQCGATPITGFIAAVDLECEIRTLTPPHNIVVFDYRG